MTDHIRLEATLIHEDSVLLRGFFGLPPIEDRGDRVLCIKYAVDRTNIVRGSMHEDRDPYEQEASRDERADGSREAYNLKPSDYPGPEGEVKDEDFPKLPPALGIPRPPLVPPSPPVVPPSPPLVPPSPPAVSRSPPAITRSPPPIPRVPDDGEVIRIIDFKGCSPRKVDELIAAMAGQPSPPRPSILHSRGLEKYNSISGSLGESQPNINTPDLLGFVTGVALRAAFGDEGFLTLFISIPYLGLGKSTTPQSRQSTPGRERADNALVVARKRLEGSRTLREHRLRHVNEAVISSSDAVLVHQTWFLVFDNVNIAVFRSENDESSDRAPLYPYQQRVGAFQALVHMIINTITSSEEAALQKFRDGVAKTQLKIHLRVDEIQREIMKIRDRSEESRQQTKESDQPLINFGDIEDLITEFGSYIINVSTMMNVVQSQIQYLGQLEQIFQNSYGNNVRGRPRPYRNSFKIPHIYGHREQIILVISALKAVIEERESLIKKLSIWKRDLELARTMFLEQIRPLNVAQATFIEAASAKTLTETLDAIEKQTQTISVFTLITTVFLPLGFFCSYYGMNPSGYVASITTPQEFWLRAGIFTGIITLVMSLFLFVSDEVFKKLLREPADWFRKLSPRDKKNGSFA